MSTGILSITDRRQIIPFLLVSLLLHMGVLLAIKQIRIQEKAVPRLIPVDVIEIPRVEKPRPRQDLQDKKPSAGKTPGRAEEKIGKGDIISPRVPSIEDAVSSGREEAALPLPVPESEKAEEAHPAESMPAPVKERPVNLWPTRERLAEQSEKYAKEIPTAEKGKTLSFDTSESRYTSYFEALRSMIYHKWEYPEVAAREGQGGKLFVRFSILKDGTIEEVILLKSSGYPILDDAALSAIRLAAPFYPFPGGFGSLERITINASFEYIIENLYNIRRR